MITCPLIKFVVLMLSIIPRFSTFRVQRWSPTLTIRHSTRSQRWMTSTPTSQGVSVRQLFEKESSTYTYLIIDNSSKSSVLIDPVLETAER